MSGSASVIASLVALIGFVGLLVVVIRTVARRAVAGALGDAATEGATTVVPARMVRGRSAAGRQLNGIGVLAVFPTEIRFVLGVPRRVVTVPYEQIVTTSVTRYLELPGKRSAGGPPYLVVEWTASGRQHTTAFQSKDADALLAVLDEHRLAGG